MAMKGFLGAAAKKNTEDAVAPYLLGCLLYEKKQTERAVDCLKEIAVLKK